MRLLLVSLLVVASAAVGQAAYSNNSFCERYAIALFGDASPASELSLVNAVVNRAILGYSAPGATYNLTGLYKDNLNGQFFNGTSTPKIDYAATANAGALATLVDHLNRFFQLGLGCRAGSASQPYSIPTGGLYQVHQGLAINGPIISAFITQVALSAWSYGVPHGTGLTTDDSTYLVALFQQFMYYGSGSSYAFEVCFDSVTCPKAQAFVEFDILTTGQFSLLPIVGGTAGAVTATINVGDYVKFDLGATDVVTQTATAGGTTALAGGLSSGAQVPATPFRSYTLQFNTVGTNYFYNAGPNGAGSGVTIIVQAAASTGMTGSTGTGGMTGASTGKKSGAVATAAVSSFAVTAVAATVAALL